MKAAEATRVLFAAHTGRWGGPNNSLWMVLRQLDPARFEPTVVFPCAGQAVEKYNAGGIATHVLGSGSGYPVGAIPGLIREIRRTRAHVVYLNNFSGSERNVGLAALLSRRPFIWHIREMLGEQRARNAFFLRFADRIVAVSEACANGVRQHVPEGTKVDVIHNAVDVAETCPAGMSRLEAREQLQREFGVPPDAPLVLTLGHVMHRKGQDLGLEVAGRVAERHPEVVFLAVGEVTQPSYHRELLARRKTLGLEKTFLFGEFRSAVEPLIVGADLLLHTARAEPFSRVVIEALASGLPVVAFGIDGCLEAVTEGETGHLIEPFDTETMAARVAQLVENPSALGRLSGNARTAMKDRLAPAQIAAQVARLIEESSRR